MLEGAHGSKWVTAVGAWRFSDVVRPSTLSLSVCLSFVRLFYLLLCGIEFFFAFVVWMLIYSVCFASVGCIRQQRRRCAAVDV